VITSRLGIGFAEGGREEARKHVLARGGLRDHRASREERQRERGERRGEDVAGEHRHREPARDHVETVARLGHRRERLVGGERAHVPRERPAHHLDAEPRDLRQQIDGGAVGGLGDRAARRRDRARDALGREAPQRRSGRGQPRAALAKRAILDVGHAALRPSFEELMAPRA
jgi:hypothetical protein